MTLLLDTHVWLWMLAAPERIRDDVVVRLRDPRTSLLLSAVSSWEIAIKWAIGRLTLPDTPASLIPRYMHESGVFGMPIQHAHAIEVSALEHHHSDPFDRMLVAQARVESVPIVTADPAFDAYDVNVVSAT